MTSQFIRLLQSPDPEQRRIAILALARLKDPEALMILDVAARTDPVPELRALAHKAIARIQHAEIDETSRNPDYDPGTIGAALNARLRGDEDGALEQLKEALAIRPNLSADPAAKYLAVRLTGLPLQDAMKTVTPPMGIRVSEMVSPPSRYSKKLLFLRMLALIAFLIATATYTAATH